MRKIKEVLRLKWVSEHSDRQIAKNCNIARSTVQEYLKRAEQAGLTWPTACNLDDTALEALLYPKNQAVETPAPRCQPFYSLCKLGDTRPPP